MPIPVYIICSQGASTDKDSGQYSIFEVIDKLVITEIPKPKAGEGVLVVERQKIVVTSTWMLDQKSGEKFDDEFDFQLEVRMEGEPALMENERTFRFQEPATLWRMTYNLLGPAPIKTSGLLVIEAKARKRGSLSWKSHSYRVVVERQKLDA